MVGKRVWAISPIPAYTRFVEHPVPQDEVYAIGKLAKCMKKKSFSLESFRSKPACVRTEQPTQGITDCEHVRT